MDNATMDCMEYNLSLTNCSNTTTTTAAVGGRSLLESNIHLTSFILSAYALIFMVGIFGNCLVLFVVARYKSMRTITNKFIACLSISDLLICLFAIPFTPMNALMTSWIFGKALCKLVQVVLLISVFVSTMTSVVIAFDRYMIVVHPHSPRMTTTIQWIVIGGIWFLASSTAIPIGNYTELKQRKDGTAICTENWPSTLSQNIYSGFIVSLQLVIPTIVITFCYGTISHQLHQRLMARSGSRLEDRERNDIQRNRRVNRMFIAMVAIFIACWLPLDIFHLVSVLIPENHQITVFLVAHLIAMSSVMYNPFLYGWMNDNFNKHFKKLIPVLTKEFSCCKKDVLTQQQQNKTHQSPNTPLLVNTTEVRKENSFDGKSFCTEQTTCLPADAV